MATTSDELAQNTLLAGLPPAERDGLRDLLDVVEYDVRDMVYEVGRTIDAVLFPVDAVFSLITSMEDGRAVEVATTGNEGFVGVPVFLQGHFLSAHEAFCQIRGSALRCDARAFAESIERSPALHAMLHRYTLALLTQIAQSSACNRLHTLEQRCARWLLLTQDRVGRDRFLLTQDFLAQMLGVRRAGVNEAQQTLQQAGAISYARGEVTVLDRDRLEELACECYGVIRDEHLRLVGSSGEPPPST